MNRVTRTDRRPSNHPWCSEPFFILFIAVHLSALPAQQNAGSPDTTQTLPGTLSSYLTSDRLFWYSKIQKFEFHEVELKYTSGSYQNYLNQSLLPYTFDPFKIDFREGSYYVPKPVRDELNLIMNRPKDSAFLPVFGIAWIAYQMASHVFELQQKRRINYDEVLAAQPALPVLFALWKISPQTVKQLYRDDHIQHVMTFSQLQEKLELLQENNLVKSRIISPDSLLYFAALTQDQILSILDYAERNISLNPKEKETIQSIRVSFRKIQ